MNDPINVRFLDRFTDIVRDNFQDENLTFEEYKIKPALKMMFDDNRWAPTMLEILDEERYFFGNYFNGDESLGWTQIVKEDLQTTIENTSTFEDVFFFIRKLEQRVKESLDESNSFFE